MIDHDATEDAVITPLDHPPFVQIHINGYFRESPGAFWFLGLRPGGLNGPGELADNEYRYEYCQKSSPKHSHQSHQAREGSLRKLLN
jgi:hypothetical protein